MRQGRITNFCRVSQDGSKDITTRTVLKKMLRLQVTDEKRAIQERNCKSKEKDQDAQGMSEQRTGEQEGVSRLQDSVLPDISSVSSSEELSHSYVNIGVLRSACQLCLQLVSKA